MGLTSPVHGTIKSGAAVAAREARCRHTCNFPRAAGLPCHSLPRDAERVTAALPVNSSTLSQLLWACCAVQAGQVSPLEGFRHRHGQNRHQHAPSGKKPVYQQQLGDARHKGKEDLQHVVAIAAHAPAESA